MSKNTIIGAVIIVVLILAGWYFIKSQKTATAPSQTESTTPATQSASPSKASEGAMMKKETVVKITANGFSPKTVTIKAGEMVTWQNTDSANHTVNSIPHPTHTLYPILNKVGLMKSGDKKSLTFPDVGTYSYHDHLNPSNTGSVTVQ